MDRTGRLKRKQSADGPTATKAGAAQRALGDRLDRPALQRACDGGPDDPSAQRAVEVKLREVGVDTPDLYRRVNRLWPAVFEGELTAAESMQLGLPGWKTTEPHYRRFQRVYSLAENEGYKFSAKSAKAFAAFLRSLEPPAWCRGLPSIYWAENRVSRARRDGMLPDLRSRIGSVGPSAQNRRRFLRAVQERFIPRVRVMVFDAIEQQVKAIARGRFQRSPFAKEQLSPAAQKDILRAMEEQVEAEVRPFALTAEYIRAFFPLFGARTTSELVRKSVRASRPRPSL